MAAGGGGKRPDPTPAAFIAAFKQLLAAHEQAAETGTPYLTEAGVVQIRRVLRAAKAGRPAVFRPAIGLVQPRWDGERHELWLGGTLLKELLHEAPGQGAILAAFQDRRWVHGYVDDPLPREPEETEDEARLRLRVTVKNLNRGLPAYTIHFRVRGTRVWWEYVPGRRRASGR